MEVQTDNTVSVGNWMLTLFLAFIPIVGIIMLIVWAVSSSTPPSKANWAKATLLWILIAIVLGVILSVVGGIGLATL